MFCPNCGRANLDSDNFCRYCGKRLTEEPAQDTLAQAPESAPQSTPEPVTDPTPDLRPEPDFSTSPSDMDFSAEESEGERKAGPSSFMPHVPSFDLRSILNAPVVLAALIAATIAVVFNLLSLSDISYAITMSESLNSTEDLNVFFTDSTLFTLFLLVPDVLILVGSWMTFAAVKAGQTKTTGLTMVKVALIIELVLLCIVLGMFELICIVAVAMFSNYDGFASSFDLEELDLDAFAMSFVQGVLVFLIVIVAAAIVLMVIYYVKAVRMTDVIRETIITGIPSDRIPVFVAVIQCIGGGIMALYSFNFLIYGEIFSVLSSACSATAAICFGVFLFEYRSKMRRLMAEPGRI